MEPTGGGNSRPRIPEDKESEASRKASHGSGGVAEDPLPTLSNPSGRRDRRDNASVSLNKRKVSTEGETEKEFVKRSTSGYFSGSENLSDKNSPVQADKKNSFFRSVFSDTDSSDESSGIPSDSSDESSSIPSDLSDESSDETLCQSSGVPSDSSDESPNEKPGRSPSVSSDSEIGFHDPASFEDQDDGIAFMDSDNEPPAPAISPKREKKSRTRPSRKASGVLLPSSVGIRPDSKRATKKEIVPLENGVSVTRYQSVDDASDVWVERTRRIEKNNIDLRAILAEDSFEAHTLLRLDHPNIIRFKGFTAEKKGHHYILATALEDGGERLDDTMQSLAKTRKTSELLGYAEQLLNGLSYLEEQKILHRDIKHNNILVNPITNVLKIVDFGSAHDCQRGWPEDSKGTDYYVAPEVRSGKPQRYSADIYSAGMVLTDSLIHLGIVSQSVIRNISPNHSIKLELVDGVELDETQKAFLDLVQSMISINPEERKNATLILGLIRRLIGQATGH